MAKDVHVKSYTREKDEKVKSHWRSRPGEGFASEIESSPLIASIQKTDLKQSISNALDKTIQGGRELWKSLSDETKENLIPFLSKQILNLGAETTKYLPNLKDSAQMLAASLNFNKDAYKIGNAFVVSNFKDVGQLSDVVKNKLQSQNLNLEITPRIVFTPESGISKAIAQSDEIKQFEKTNRKALEQRALVEKKDLTINLSSTTNLKTAINNADILFAYYDDNGDLITAILDTYDFNKNENNSLVKMGYNVQEAGLLTNYFDIFFTRTPKSELYD